MDDIYYDFSTTLFSIPILQNIIHNVSIMEEIVNKYYYHLPFVSSRLLTIKYQPFLPENCHYELPTVYSRILTLWIANSFFQNTDIVNCQQFLPEYWHYELPTVSSRILTLWNSNNFFHGRNCWQFIMSVFWNKLLAIHNDNFLVKKVGIW
jgi:hypothetical protein